MKLTLALLSIVVLCAVTLLIIWSLNRPGGIRLRTKEERLKIARRLSLRKRPPESRGRKAG